MGRFRGHDSIPKHWNLEDTLSSLHGLVHMDNICYTGDFPSVMLILHCLRCPSRKDLTLATTSCFKEIVKAFVVLLWVQTWTGSGRGYVLTGARSDSLSLLPNTERGNQVLRSKNTNWTGFYPGSSLEASIHGLGEL